MQLPINKDGNIELDLFEIVSEVVNKATPEEQEAIVEYFGFQKPIRKWMVDRLANEYSRPSFYEEIHEDRLALLKQIKQEELAFYADLIAQKVADERRHNKAYWELYHWCSNHGITRTAGFPRQALNSSDWDWKNEVAEIVEEIIKQKRPDLLEVKTEGEA